MKKRIIHIALTLTFVLTFLCIGVFSSPTKAAVNADIPFAGASLNLGDTVYINYYLPATDGLQLLTKKGSVPDGSDIGSGDENVRVLSSLGRKTVNDVLCDVFRLPVKASEMSINFYARPMVSGELGSKVSKYSIWQYAYNKRNAASPNLALLEVIDTMLDYGAASQKYFGRNLDRLANAKHYQISVVDGTLSDTTKKGLYLEGEVVTLIAPAVNEAGDVFSRWVDAENKTVALTAECEIEVEAHDSVYTPIYEKEVHYSEGLSFLELLDGVYCVSKGTCEDTDIMIPPTYLGKPVAVIPSGAFSNCSTVTSITIPESVTTIYGSAFLNCSGLTSITIPNSVTSIGFGAFAGCNNLSSISVPFVGKNADETDDTHFGYIFGADSNLSNEGYVPASLKTVIITGGEKIDSYAFNECENITSIIIHDSIWNIKESAFLSCDNLANVIVSENNDYYSSVDGVLFNKGQTQIVYYPQGKPSGAYVIPSGVTSIKPRAFSNRDSVTSITIPNGVTVVSEGMCYGCSNLTSVTIPGSVKFINDWAFAYCSNLTSITFGGTIEQWNAITKRTDWDKTYHGYTVHCIDGNITK